MLRGGVVASILVLGALLGSRVAAAEEASQQSRIAVLAGAGFGLNGLGDVPGPLVEAHAGGGWRGQQWMFAGMATYAYTDSKPLLAYWSITRHDVELAGLVVLRPMPPSTVSVHVQLGMGAAFDRLYGVDPPTSARALSASFGLGGGWGPASLTFRVGLPDPEVCASSACHRAPAQIQLFLSLTVDAVALVQ